MTNEGAFTYNPMKDGLPTVDRMMRSEAEVRLLMGPVGSGKSSACCMEILRRAMAQKPGVDGKRRSRFAVIRNTYAELRDTTRKTFEDWIDPQSRRGALGMWHESDFRWEWHFGDVRGEVLFRALDRPEDVKKLLSLELTGAYINEAKEVPRQVLDMLLSRIGRYPAIRDGGSSWCGVFMDTNPPDNDHWIYRVFEEERPNQLIDLPDGSKKLVTWEIFKQPDGLSPQAENLKNLRPGYYQIQAVGKDEDWVNVYLRGRYGFVREGKPVWPAYRDDVHCVPEIPMLMTPVYLGMDFGLTPACPIAQRDPRDGQLQVVDELVADDMGAAEFGRVLARKLKTEYAGREVEGWGDPAGAQRSQADEKTPYDMLSVSGLHLNKAPTNDPLIRVEAVTGLLQRLTVMGRPGLVVHPRAKTLRKAMQGGYAYKRVQVSGQERYHDEPAKNAYSHVADALQYLCVGLGEDVRIIRGPRQSVARVQVHRSFRSIGGSHE